jgi:probable phosphoglycerate mutase
MKATKLLIARHGNTFAPGTTVTRVGMTDLPLVARGREQGRALGEYLFAHDLIPARIFTSTLCRTIQTAEEIVLGLGSSLTPTSIPIESLAIFNEIDYGPDENRSEAEVIARVGIDAIAAWDSDGTVPPGWRVDPEQIRVQWRRFGARLIADYRGETALVVTSNGIARFAPCLLTESAGLNPGDSIKLATGAVSLFESEDDGWRCCWWNVRP